MQELPSINFIRKCLTNIQSIGETLEAYRIGKVEKWNQLLSEITVRHEIPLWNLVIRVIDEEHLLPLILSTSIILEGDISEQHVGAVLSTIVGYRKLLQRWAEVFENSHLSYQHNIPGLSSNSIGKLG